MKKTPLKFKHAKVQQTSACLGTTSLEACRVCFCQDPHALTAAKKTDSFYTILAKEGR
jgi:hypothetical protein